MAAATGSSTAIRQQVCREFCDPYNVVSPPNIFSSSMQHRIGDTYVQLGNLDRAKRSYTEAVAWSPPNNPDLSVINEKLTKVLLKLAQLNSSQHSSQMQADTKV